MTRRIYRATEGTLAPEGARGRVRPRHLYAPAPADFAGAPRPIAETSPSRFLRNACARRHRLAELRRRRTDAGRNVCADLIVRSREFRRPIGALSIVRPLKFRSAAPIEFVPV